MNQRRLNQEKKMQDFLNKFPDIAKLRDNKLNSKVNTISQIIQSPPTASSIVPVAPQRPVVSEGLVASQKPRWPVASQGPQRQVTSQRQMAQQRSIASQRQMAQLLSLPHFTHMGPVMQRPILVNTGMPSGNLVTVSLVGGLGNWIFMILAGLGYAEKYGKQFVLSNNLIKQAQSGKKQAHELNLESHIKRIFPGLTYADSVNNATEIKEFNEFNYSSLPNASSNVILKGYFQAEGYFPSPSLIPDIRTAYYENTYFIHIRAGDYINNKDWCVNLIEYYKKCFSILGNVNYIVFSNDNDYADNYMKQFNISYTISDKVDQVDTLIEMANCAGGICANSSFSWLGAFFQGYKRGKVFMPSLWCNGKDITGIYSPWTSVVSVTNESNPLIKTGIVNYINKYKLINWQNTLKDHSKLIVQASSTSGGDLWMPFPIGMNFTYVKYFNRDASLQIGSHENLVLCAVKCLTDSKRRPSGINRKLILNNLEKNGIQNMTIMPNEYFSTLPKYKFVISPEGNGIDCHRHYEALIAGCIPIIEFNDQIQAKYKNLPILYTNDYSEITPEYLEKKYDEMLSTEYDFSRLFLSYYSKTQQEEIKICGKYWIERHCGLNVNWYENMQLNRTTGIKWITIINYGYIDFTKNFLESMKKYNSLFPLIVYCLDNQTIEALQGYSNVTCIDATLFINKDIHDSFSKWGDSDYKKVCFYKLDAIKNALEKNPGITIGYIDTDIIVLKDPTPTVITYMNTNPSVQLFTQCDENKSHTKCSNKYACPNFCAGICILRNNSITLDLVDYHKRDITKNVTDQDYLLEISNKNNIGRMTIERNIFLNGEYPGVNNNTTLTIPDTAELIHYNYIIGKEKINFMKKNSMWFLLNNAIIIKSHDAGMGSLFNTLILQINEIKNNNSDTFPVVMWDTTKYGKGNIFNKYFRLTGFSSSSEYVVRNTLEGRTFSENIPNYRKILHNIYKDHIIVNPIITDKVNSIFINRSFDYLIGVHFRNTDRAIEPEYASPGTDKVSKRVLDVLNENAGKKIAIYIASDNKPDVSYFKNYLSESYEGFNDIDIIEDPDNVRSDDEISVHGTHDKGNDTFTPEQKALSILVDIYSLSKCDILVRTCSNVTCSSCIINMNSKIIDVSLEHGKITEKWLSE